jgi:hypothetical protein
MMNSARGSRPWPFFCSVVVVVVVVMPTGIMLLRTAMAAKRVMMTGGGLGRFGFRWQLATAQAIENAIRDATAEYDA